METLRRFRGILRGLKPGYHHLLRFGAVHDLGLAEPRALGHSVIAEMGFVVPSMGAPWFEGR